MASTGEAVKVVVRSRPFNSKEITEERQGIVDMDINLNQVSIRNPKEPESEPKRFTFDAVYDENSTQRAVYDETGYPLVEAVLSGYNGTMFAYGQVRAAAAAWQRGVVCGPRSFHGRLLLHASGGLGPRAPPAMCSGAHVS
jgi:hypothetical protein